MKNVTEGYRYLENAKEILREKAQKEDNLYKDSKYVRMAGHTAYSGVLVALDGLFGDKLKGKKSVEWYKALLSKEDKKILAAFSNAYSTLHIEMGYEGNQSAEYAALGLKEAERIINWVETRMEKTNDEL